MFKPVLLLSALVAFAAAAHLKVRPDEVKAIWHGIADELKERIEEGEKEIHVVLGPLQEFVDSAKDRLQKELQEGTEPYYQEIAELEHNPDPAVHRCLEESLNEVQKYQETITMDHYQRYDQIAEEAQREVDISAKVAADALEEFREVNDRVERCNEIECAGELEVLITEFYTRAIEQIDDAVEHATKAALIQVPLDLDESALNKELYTEYLIGFGQQAKTCAGVDPEPQPGPQPDPQPDPQPGPHPQ